MLRRLRVDNLAVIDEAEIELGSGLTVITGETGAGKTMLTQAVRLICGERAEPTLVGPEHTEAYVEAEFDDDAPAALADVHNEDEPLVLARRLRKEGGARALCDGRACSADALRDASSTLIYLTGQHAARRLVDPIAQLAMIDQSGNLVPLRGKVGQAWKSLRSAREDLDALRNSLADRDRRLALLSADVDAVRSLDPQAGEDTLLEEEQTRLANAVTLRESVRAVTHALVDDEPNLIDGLLHLTADLASDAEHDRDLATLRDNLLDCSERLADAGREARALAEGYESDPERLQEVETRLGLLRDLRRRFSGLSLEAILQRTDTDERELDQLRAGDERLAELEAAAKEASAKYDRVTQELRNARKKAARKLIRATETHLHSLGLADARLSAEWEDANPSSRGIDRVRMLLAANQGLQAAPLDKGASGGELSRVNLALLLASSPAEGTFIFDEVDAGIGGDAAHTVAAKLKDLSATVQVIVVTHLAQVAVQADTHISVRKKEVDGRSRTVLVTLTSEQDREAEIARLIGADSSDQETARTAARLVQSAGRAG